MSSSFSLYNETLKFMQGFDYETICPATESSIIAKLISDKPSKLDSSVAGLTQRYDGLLDHAIAEWRMAQLAEDDQRQLKALADINNIILTWKAQLKKLPVETLGQRAAHTTAKIATVVIAVTVVYNSPKLINKLMDVCSKVGIDRHFSRKIAAYTVSAADADAFRRLFGIVYNWFMHRTNKNLRQSDAKTRDLKKQYAEDPHSYDGYYIRTLAGLDDWQKLVSEQRLMIIQRIEKRKKEEDERKAKMEAEQKAAVDPVIADQNKT